jgi:DNA-binding transcriptional MerR regulator
LNKETTIPDKLYFKIGEVCDITGVKQHVLRYWESEFKILSPQRAHSRQRLYRREDVENILRIKRLLKEEGFTISGAKKLLAAERRRPRPAPEPPSPAKPAAAATPSAAGDQAKAATIFSGIKEELLTLKKILEQR